MKPCSGDSGDYLLYAVLTGFLIRDPVSNEKPEIQAVKNGK